jgi:hypothetical protein
MANNPGNPKMGTQSVPLTSFFGWTTDAPPQNLPEGLSPDNGQVEYLVGSVNQRDGVQNVFAFSGEQTGPNGPSSGTDLPVGSIAWQNPSNITAKDGSYATLNLQTSFTSARTPASVAQSGGGTAWTNPNNFVSTSLFTTVTLTSGSVSELLAGTNAGFSIPATATITGLQFNWKSGATTGGCSQSLALVNGGVQISPTFSSAIPTTITAQQVGGAGNLLSSPLTPAVLNSSTFGVSLQTSSSSGAVLNMRQRAAYIPPSLGSSQQSIVMPMPFPVLAGNTIVLSFDAFDFTAGSTAVNVTDNLGNTYHQVHHTNDGEHDTFMYWGHVTTGGTCNITINPTTGHHSNSFITAAGGEFAGLLQPETTDGANGNFGLQSNNLFNSGTISTTNAMDVIFTATYNNNGNATQPTGYTMVAQSNTDSLFGSPGPGGPATYSLAYLQVNSTGTYSPTWSMTGANFNGIGTTVAFKLVATPTISAGDLNLTAYYTVPGTADTLRASNFNFALSSDTVLGLEVGITGHISGVGTAQAVLTDATGNPVGLPKTFTFSPGDSRIILGSLTDSWGTILSSSMINSSNFGVNIFGANGTAITEWFVDFVDVTVAQNPSGSSEFNWVKTYKRSTGNYNLALTQNGVLWLEDLQLAPNLLSSVYVGILPDMFAKSVTFENREFIALSNRIEGIDMPRQWNGPYAALPSSSELQEQAFILQDPTKALVIQTTLSNGSSPVPNGTITFHSGNDGSILGTAAVVNPNGVETKIAVSALVNQNTHDSVVDSTWYDNNITATYSVGGVTTGNPQAQSLSDNFGALAGDQGVIILDPDGHTVWACAGGAYDQAFISRYDLTTKSFVSGFAWPFNPQNNFGVGDMFTIEDGTNVLFQDPSGNLYGFSACHTGSIVGSNNPRDLLHSVMTTNIFRLPPTPSIPSWVQMATLTGLSIREHRVATTLTWRSAALVSASHPV